MDREPDPDFDFDFDFNFDAIPVPFRMQPGLQRLASPLPLTPLAPNSALWREKQAVVQAGASRHAVPGFDAEPALAAIAALGAWNPAVPLELAFEEDFAVLDGDTGALPWLCVCTPSHWAPEDKLGLDFAAVHAPVADAALILSAAGQWVRLVTDGGCWTRQVWSITPCGRFDQHPRRQPRTPWPAEADPANFASACWLRVERQAFFPVGQGLRQAVFSIRVLRLPLVAAVDSAAKARRLHDSLASMSTAVLDYKGLAPARERLLHWLTRRCQA